MDTAHIDSDLAALQASKQRWANLPITAKIEYLDAIKAGTVRVAQAWVEDSVEAKGLSMDHGSAGEEWISGPYTVLHLINALRSSLVRIDSGVPLLEGHDVYERDDGQVVVNVFPSSFEEQLVFSGISAEVWMQPAVTVENLDESVGSFYRASDPEGDVCVVLAAGNVASIAVLDTLHALFNQGKVVVLKMNPVNDYLGLHFEQVFAELVADGYIRFAYGGADVGKYLTENDGTDSIHITGSAATYEAIVFGQGAEGIANKADDTPINPRSLEAELGGVGPVIVVPGKWSKRDLRFQAEHLVSQKMHNSGFNCIAAQVVIMPEGWDLADAFLDEIRGVMAELPDRPAYYPGALDRCSAAIGASASVESFGSADPRFLITDIVSTDVSHHMFKTEVFGPVLAVTSLPCPDVPSYLIKAVRFANEDLDGSLGINVLIDPTTERKYGNAFRRTLADLRYGSIAINIWIGAAYFTPQCAWGAFPGHVRTDIQSGSGFVHNVLMFDEPQKSIIRGPFAPFHRAFLRREFHVGQKLPYFVTNKQAQVVGERLVAYSDTGGVANLAKVFSAAVRG